MATRSRSIPSPSTIDREWPHQVALPDDICTAHNFTLIRHFCGAHGLEHWTRQVQAIWPSGKYEEWRLHCFRDAAAAEAFRVHFGGIAFNPIKNREGGRAHGVWRREGDYKRIFDQGPLSVPEALRS
ncbi:hypothetical protein [Mesorhizobium sp.]|uniref:hypothetical protein n=1 Tax=Mesorhizobium sp. TaxID=1871066 RepID=UPI0025F55551|nr:hypothetical protein [Mesorhizobium sp.]